MPTSSPQPLHGQIIREYGQTLLVESDTGIVYECFRRKNLAPLTVGDFVLFEVPESQQTPVIVERLTRSSILMRRDRYHPVKEIAANITQVMVVLAVTPKTNEFYLDQYLCAAELSHLPALIVLNKIDLNADTEAFTWLNYYHTIGYPVLKISVHTQANIAELKNYLRAQTTLMLGASGVGKSSLLNLLTGQAVRTAEISLANQKGQHTTSTASLYHLPFEGTLIDAPGIREFNLVAAQQAEFIHGFREFKPFLGQCKFRNCQHGAEPGCALKAALASGKIHPQRFKSYLRGSDPTL